MKAWPPCSGRIVRTVAGEPTLSRELSYLNKSLALTWLQSDREFIALHPDLDLWLDLHTFQQALDECQNHGHPPDEVCQTCLSPLTRAIETYRDDFLAGFTLPGLPGIR